MMGMHLREGVCGRALVVFWSSLVWYTFLKKWSVLNIVKKF